MMTRDELLASAERLQSPSPEAARRFGELGDALASELNQRMANRNDLDKLIGPDNLAMMKENSFNMVRFMHSIFVHYDPQVLVDTVHWVFRTYRCHGFQVSYWPANLNTFSTILQEKLDEGCCQEIRPFFAWLIAHTDDFAEITNPDSFSSDNQPT